MSDCISRQAAIDEIVTWLKDRMTDGKNGKPLTDRIKDLPPAQPEAPCYLGSPCEYQNPNAEIQEECKLDGTAVVAKSKRTFVELLVHYPHPDVCMYPEYKGKPYYSIKYIEDGECFVGFGTYKPEVLSQYLRDYFMPFAQPEERTDKRTETHASDSIGRQVAIDAVLSVIPYDKYWAEQVEKAIRSLPPAQPEERTKTHGETRACD